MRCTRNRQCRRPRKEDFNLQHDRPEMFVVAQCGPPVVAVIWHGVWSSYFTVTLLLDILVVNKSQVKPTWLIYSQNWGSLLVIFTSFIEFLSRLVAMLARKDIVHGDSRTMEWYLKLQWVSINTNNVTSVVLMGLYNVVLTPELSFNCLNKIISPSVYVLFSTTVINVQPVKFFHFYQPAVFALVFVIIASAVPRTSNQIPAEPAPIFKRDKPVESGLFSVCVIIIVIPLVHLLFYLIFKLRIFSCNKHFSENSGSKCSLHAAIQRDTTTTDVVLEDSAGVTYIELKPDTKDDIALHVRAKEFNSGTKPDDARRINKSETDLRDYRSRNGFFCDFGASPDIFHHTNPEEPERRYSNYSQSRTSADTSKGSQIILVKSCNGHVNEAFEGDSSCSDDDVDSHDNRSNASSDFYSEYINQDILPYM